MTDLLEQMKTRAEQAQTAYEAYKAECEKVEELPEVWYLHTDGDCGQHFGAGESTGILWNHATDKETSHTRRFSSRSESFTACTAAEYNNARALYHGADFTGRLHEIDRPVCELNKATREEMELHDWDEYELVDGEIVLPCRGKAKSTLAEMDGREHIYRLRAPKKRPMTCKEVALWCSSADAAGWVYRVIGSKRWHLVTAWDCYDYPIEHERAPIATLNDDGTGGEWEAFEVEA